MLCDRYVRRTTLFLQYYYCIKIIVDLGTVAWVENELSPYVFQMTCCWPSKWTSLISFQNRNIKINLKFTKLYYLFQLAFLFIYLVAINWLLYLYVFLIKLAESFLSHNMFIILVYRNKIYSLYIRYILYTKYLITYRSIILIVKIFSV